MKASVTNERVVTEQEVINEANSIWKKVQARKLNIDDTARCDETLRDMQLQHVEFSKSYPIVLRYMCQMVSYKERALKYYLTKLKTTTWKDESSYLDSQTEYVVLLYKENHRGWKPAVVSQYRDSVRKMLQHEHDSFKDRLTKCVEEFDAKDAEYKARELQELIQHYTDNQEYLSTCDRIPTTVKTDLPIVDDNSEDVLTQLDDTLADDAGITAHDLLL